ncbi:MAG: hemerythrin domain-containing protein, partial [Pseudolysinimonas sp.]
EITILPIAARAMTQSAWDRIGGAARAAVPRDKQFVQLGFILASMPPEQREKWRKEFLPGPVRLLYNLVGKRQYEKHRALVYGNDA